MHELSYVLDIIDQAANIKEKEKAKKIKQITVDVGEMSGVVPYYLDKYFKESIKDTFLENTELKIFEKEVIIKCENCGSEYHPEAKNYYCCPDCNGRAGKLIQGKGVIIKNIVIEDED